MKFFVFFLLLFSLTYANDSTAVQSVYVPAPSTIDISEPTPQQESAKKTVYSTKKTKPHKSAFRSWIAPSILGALTIFCGTEAMSVDDKAADLAKTKVSTSYEYSATRQDIRDYQDTRNGLLVLTGVFGAAFITSMFFSIAF